MAIDSIKDVTQHADDDTISIPVAEEQLQVGIARLDTGRGVRVHKAVTERAQQIDATLLRDAVDVRRVPVDQIVALSDAPGARQEGDTYIVPVLEEVLVVEKRVRIKEEIHITRTAREEQVADTVMLRSEQVSIEHFDECPDPTATSPLGGNHHATHTRSRL